MEIKSVEISNFQKHKHLKIDFEDITTIVGCTDSGKSSVIRAIVWVLTNKPSGIKYIRRKQPNPAIVAITFSDGNVVTRQRGKTENKYFLNGMELCAFGNDVPAEIQQIIQTNYINFQRQFDSVFWFSEKAGEISRQLNAIVNLEQMDRVVRNLDTKFKRGRVEVEVLQTQNQEAKKNGKALEFVKEMDKELTYLEELDVECQKTLKKSSILNDRIQDVKTYRDTSGRLIQAILDGKKVVNKGMEWEETAKQTKILSGTIESIKKLQTGAKRKVPTGIETIEHLYTEYQTYQTQHQKLSTILNRIKEGKDQTCLQEKRLNTLEKTFREQMGKNCPLCGTTLS